MNPTGKGGFRDHPQNIKKSGTKRKNFEDVRALAQLIANEPIKGKEMTVIEAILRTWAQSKDPRLQMAFVAYAYGTPPTKTELTGADGEPIKFVEVILSDNGDTTD